MERADKNPVGLSLPDDLSQKEWVEIGHRLKEAEGALLWWIGDWARFGKRSYGDGYADVIEATGFAYDTIRKAVSVANRFEFGRRRPNLSFSHHADVASLDPEDADELLDHAESQKLGRKQFRQTVARFKRQGRLDAGVRRAADLGDQVFSLIYIDPPWRYEDQAIDGERAIETHYPTMALEEILALPVSRHAAQDAVIFCWSTAPNAPGGFAALEAWGFDYVSQWIWAKDRIGTGYWGRNKHEILLIGKRGDMPPPNEDKRPETVIRGERTEHSAKPPVFRELIAAAYPELPKIEMFARGAAPEGWVFWGDQAEWPQ